MDHGSGDLKTNRPSISHRIWTLIRIMNVRLRFIFLMVLVGLVVGVVISLLQALTQIQEMTLVFVPKILAIFAAMLIALPFMADLLQSHMLRIAARIAAE